MIKTKDRKTSENCDNAEERLWRPELRWWPWKQKEERKYPSCSEGDPRLMDDWKKCKGEDAAIGDSQILVVRCLSQGEVVWERENSLIFGH